MGAGGVRSGGSQTHEGEENHPGQEEEETGGGVGQGRSHWSQ